MNFRKIIFWVAIFFCFALFFVGGVWIGVNKIAYHVPQPGTIDFSLFWDAYNKLQENFIDTSKISNKEVIYGAIEGMTNSLKDPYTNFFDPTQAQIFQQDLSGSFEGIGIEIGIRKEILTVIAPLKNTPGEKAGLRAGDMILKIDGKDTIGMTTEDAVNLIRGSKGTQVTLFILRDGWDKAKDITITRGTIIVPSIEWALKNDDVAYIQIYQFSGSLPVDFEAIAFEILQSGAKKIILDLRNNPGGYLDVAQTIAGWFLEKGQVVAIEDFGKEKEQKIYKTEGKAIFSEYSLVILINQGSASASEILAGSLRDNRGIKLIGEKSFGKGCVQEVITLRDGSFLKVTIANWLTPKGSSISDVGLTPDIKVAIPDDFDSSLQENDPQFDKALEIINALK